MSLLKAKHHLCRGAKGASVAEGPRRPLGSGKVGAKQLKRTDRTLCFFMLALQGHDVVVELRAGNFLKGTVYMADVHWKCAFVLVPAVGAWNGVFVKLHMGTHPSGCR